MIRKWIGWTGILFFPITQMLSGCGTSEGGTEIDQTGVTLKGRVNYPQNGFVTLERFTIGGLDPYDTITINPDRTFNQFIPLENPGYYRLNFYGKQTTNLILNKDDLEIIADGNAVSGFLDIQGSTELQQLKTLNQFLQSEFVSRENKLNQEFVSAKQSKNEELALEVQESYLHLLEQKEKETLNEIRNMGASLATLQALNYIDKDKNFPFVDSLSQMLTKAYPSVPNVQQLSTQVEKMRLLAVGQPAPEIALPSLDGKIVKLSSFRGQYVLLDFWAEWCKPCRVENPNIVKAYNAYHDKGFEVFGVSLDKTREKWLRGITEDGLTWTHVSDLKGWQSEGARIYNVSGIPASFLLDPQGIIIGKNLRGPKLLQKLEELLGAQP